MILISIWLFVGLLFGWPRAKAAYRESMELNKVCEIKEFHSRMDATIEAVVELVKWMLLGFLSAISYIAWLLLPVVIESNKKQAKPNSVEALFFSVLIFTLGTLTLDRRNTKT